MGGGEFRLFNPKEPLPTGLMCHQYRFTEFQAAIIYDQLQHQPAIRIRTKHQASAKLICEILKDVSSIKLQRSSKTANFQRQQKEKSQCRQLPTENSH